MPSVSDVEWDSEFGRWTYTVTNYADKGKVMLVSFDTKELALLSRIAMVCGDELAAVIGSEIEVRDERAFGIRRAS